MSCRRAAKGLDVISDLRYMTERRRGLFAVTEVLINIWRGHSYVYFELPL